MSKKASKIRKNKIFSVLNRLDPKFGKKLLQTSLKSHANNPGKVARAFYCSETTIIRYMKKYGIHIPSKRNHSNSELTVLRTEIKRLKLKMKALGAKRK